jgi:hypothetical protein
MNQTDDVERITDLLREATADEFPQAGSGPPDGYEVLSSMRMNAEGLIRYWRTRQTAAGDTPARAESAAEGGTAPVP